MRFRALRIASTRDRCRSSPKSSRPIFLKWSLSCVVPDAERLRTRASANEATISSLVSQSVARASGVSHHRHCERDACTLAGIATAANTHCRARAGGGGCSGAGAGRRAAADLRGAGRDWEDPAGVGGGCEGGDAVPGWCHVRGSGCCLRLGSATGEHLSSLPQRVTPRYRSCGGAVSRAVASYSTDPEATS